MKPKEFVKNDECPSCLRQMDCATAVSGEAKPSPGDVSICINCGTFLRFDPDLNIELLDDDSFDAFPEDSRATLSMAKQLIKQMGFIK